MLNNGETVVQYYVPYLSAIQIFTSNATLNRFREETERRDCEMRYSSDSCSDESENEKFWRGDGGSPKEFGFERESLWPLNDRLGYLYFQYFERSTPYGRVPPMDKVIGQEIPESPGCFSNMDFSPYQERKRVQLDNDRASIDAHQMDSTDATVEGLVAVTQSLDINKDDPKCKDLNEEGAGFRFEQNFGANCPSDQFVFGSNTKKVDHDSDTSAAATTTESSFSSKRLRGKKVMSRSCLRALVLCYSNRAVTKISLGRVREALEDCKIAIAIDPISRL